MHRTPSDAPLNSEQVNQEDGGEPVNNIPVSEQGRGQDQIERRQFLKLMGLAAGGAALMIGTGMSGNRLAAAQPANVGVTITRADTPVNAGDWMDIEADIRNNGPDTLTIEARLIVGHEPDQVDSEQVTVAPGGSERVVLGYETYPVRRTQEFPVRIETDHGTDAVNVMAYGTEDEDAPSRRQETGVSRHVDSGNGPKSVDEPSGLNTYVPDEVIEAVQRFFSQLIDLMQNR